MARTIVEPLPHDLAVIAALESIGQPVGFSEAPDGALSALLAANDGNDDYLVLHPLNTVRDGSLSDPYADADLVYQITIVGRAGSGVRWLAGQIEEALLTVTVAGRSVTHVVVEDFGDIRPDRDVGPPHPLYATPRVRLSTTPA